MMEQIWNMYLLKLLWICLAKPQRRTAGARMKKYELDASATNDGKLQSNDIVLFDMLMYFNEE